MHLVRKKTKNNNLLLSNVDKYFISVNLYKLHKIISSYWGAVAQFAPPINLCVIPYGLCTSADPSGVVCKERCLNVEGRNYVDGICMTNPGTCMCCYRMAV